MIDRSIQNDHSSIPSPNSALCEQQILTVACAGDAPPPSPCALLSTRGRDVQDLACTSEGDLVAVLGSQFVAWYAKSDIEACVSRGGGGTVHAYKEVSARNARPDDESGARLASVGGVLTNEDQSISQSINPCPEPRVCPPLDRVRACVKALTLSP